MVRLVFIWLALLGLAACAGGTFNLPAVSTDTDGQRSAGKFIWHDLITEDPDGSRAFYSSLFGWEFRSLNLLGASYWVIELDGVPLGGMVARDAEKPGNPSQWVSVISVDDPDAAVATARAAGGTVLREPVSLGERGTIAVLGDGQKGLFATLTTPHGDPRDRDTLPKEGRFFWHELWTPDVAAAGSFYQQLTGLELRSKDLVTRDGGTTTAQILYDGERARAAIRSLPDPAMPTMWMPYLRLGSEARLAELLEAVPQAGGKVLIPALERPLGGYVAVIAGPSGAPVALQTWTDDQPLPREQKL